jgi:lysophospholipase L1-like esterase
MKLKTIARVAALCSLWLPTLCGGLRSAPPEEKAVREVPRTDQNSLLAHADLQEKAKKGGVDLYFEGDSITRRWGATDYPKLLDSWKENFFGWNAADFAWGGDTTRNILWRLNDGELDGVHPKVIVLLAGTNDLFGLRPGGETAMVEGVTAGIRAILDVMREKAPEATVILMGVLPRNDNMALIPVIRNINRNLEALADGRKIRYLNINDKLANDEGVLFEGMTDPDKLHLALKGYQVWADALKPLLRELLGPPAKEDHAPPPTGNPAVRN